VSEPTATDYQALILAQVGDDDQRTLANQIALIWRLQQASDTDLYGRYLLAWRASIDVMLARVRTAVNFKALGSGEAAVSLSDLSKHLQVMRTNVEEQLQHYQSTGMTPVIAQMETTAPIVAPSGRPDANDSRYRGNPYQ
jgi:hypothetical protein